MKKPRTTSALLRMGLALTLTCGLMLPTGALSAYGDETRTNEAPPPKTLLTDLSFDTDVNEPAQDDTDSAETGAPEQVTEGAEESPEGAATVDDSTPSDTENVAGAAVVSVATSAASQGATFYSEAASAPSDSDDLDALDEAIASPADAKAADYTKNGLTVSGGVLNVDFKDTGSALEVLTGTPLTFTGSSTYAIHIGQGVKADVTLAGVNLTGASTLEVLTNRTGQGEGTYCYLTIKDGTTNILRPETGYGPGLRCGKTSTLVIDDENPNIVSGGSKLNVADIITPKGGKVGFDGTTLNGTIVTAQSSLDLLDSPKPGTLKAYARPQSAGIGGSAAEDGGTLIFNGGIIYAMGTSQTEDNLTRTTDDGTAAGGAGIGAGNMANGGVTIFNGGTITAKAAFHGSGIGGGYCNPSYFSAASTQNGNAIHNTSASIGNKSVAGDITINGGYIKSYSSGHGNAFGQACCGNNSGKTITVTGGTLLPWSNGSYYDIGGAGGYVVITGGSIKLTGAKAGQAYTGNKFQSGESNKAFNAPPGDPNRQQIFMFCVDLSKSDNIGTEPVASWDLEIGGVPYEYGAPSYFDEGKLYLWLPISAVGKEITVKLKRYDENGELKPIEDLTAKPNDSSGSGLGKRWISYSLTDEFMEENENLFSKYYDGVSISNLITAVETYTTEKGLPAPYGANPNAVLSKGDELVYQSAKLGDDGKPLEEYYPATASHDHGILPSDSGSLSVRIQSTEFAQPGTPTAESFWGHETTVNVSIFPVNSKTSFVPFTLTADDGSALADLEGPTWMQDDAENPNKASVNHLIVPVDITSFTYPNGDIVDGSNMTKPTCQAPFGQVQLFLDGDPISAAHGGVMTFTRDDLENPSNKNVLIVNDPADGNREHTVLLFDISRSQLEAHGLKSTDNDEHTVMAKYSSRTDAKPATSSVSTASAAPLALDDTAASTPSAVYRNYYDSETEETLVQIQKSDCKFDLYNEKDTSYDPDNETSTPILDEAHIAQTVFYNIADFTSPNASTFPLYVDTNSIGEVTFTSSNPNVLTISPAKVPSRSDRFTDPDDEDFGFGATATVHAAGRTTITATIASTGAFREATRTFDVYIYPDPAAKPVITDVETAYNLSRNDGSIRPYDTLRYSATFTNETPNSSFQNPVFALSVPADTTLKSLSVTDPEGRTQALKEGVDYRIENPLGRSLRTLAAYALGKPDLTPNARVLTVSSLPALFGNQSYRFTMDVSVNPDVVAKSADDMDFYSQSTANGVYGIDPDHDEKYPWDTRIPGTGNKTDEAWDDADPTSVDPTDPDAPKPPTIEDIIGGGLVNPEDPDNPDRKPGVEVGDTVPGGPLDAAEKPDPDSPDDPDKRTPDPIKPNDRIVSVGDTPDPSTSDDVKKEIDEQIKKKLEEDPDATEVEIPVTIDRYDPDHPDDPPSREEVIITVPIPSDYDPDGPNPDDRDDHELIVIPADPKPAGDDEGPADIELAKKAENITPGRDQRGNQSVALVGDLIRYTVTVTNSRPGTCWYDVIVRDLIPVGMAYVKGTAVIVDAQGNEHTDFPDDFADGTSDVAFSVGDVPGGTSATISFECTVTPALLDGPRPVNVARAAGTPPSDTITPEDPTNPEGPVKQDRDPQPPGPVDPANPDIWPEDAVTPETPPTPIDDVVPADPERGKLSTSKSAVNLDRQTGEVYVGDTIRYTITFSNDDEPWTGWYDVVIQDKLPKGIVPLSGGIKLTQVDGSEINCPDSVYSSQSGDVTVFVGPVRGGQSITLTVNAMVTDEALGTDIGNVAFAYGTDPSDTDSSVLEGNPSGTSGSRYDAIDELEKAADEGAGYRSESKVAYPENYDGKVRPAPDDEAATKLKTTPLAKTDDAMPANLPLGLAILAAAASCLAILAIRRLKRYQVL